MPARLLVDTNVLIYAHDRTDLRKQARALELLDRLTLTRQGVLSVQVLAEFFWVSTKKLADPLRQEEAQEQVEGFLQTWHVAELTALTILEAIRGVREHRLNYWDAQVWATALLNQVPLVLSEDFSDGQMVEGIRFLNPFSRHFQMAYLNE